MQTLIRLTAIAIGYALAFLVAWGVLALYVAASDSPERQASSGMASFGDAFVFLCAFGLASLLPTVAALLVLRRFRWFWAVLASVAVAVALSGAASVLAWIGLRADIAHPMHWLAQVAPLRMLFAPPLIGCSGAAAICAPGRRPRVALALAALIESAACLGLGIGLLRLA